MTLPEYPHTYKRQRQFEKGCTQSRDKQLGDNPNSKMPPICGFTYSPRKPKRIDPSDWDDAPVACSRTAGAGTTHHGHGYCDYHEVQAEREASKGRKGMTRDVQEAKKVAYANSSFFGDRKPVDPHDALLTEIGRTAGIIDWIDAHMVEMRDGGGMTEDGILTQFTKQNGWVPGVWMELYRAEREHLVRTCTAAIKAGVAERRVKIAEQQGQLIVAMMLAFIHDPELGLTAAQVSKAPKLVRKHILELPRASEDDPTMAIIEANSSAVPVAR